MGAVKMFHVLGRDMTITEIANILDITKGAVYSWRRDGVTEEEFLRTVTQKMEDKGIGTNELGEALDNLRTFKMRMTRGKYQESEEADEIRDYGEKEPADEGELCKRECERQDRQESMYATADAEETKPCSAAPADARETRTEANDLEILNRTIAALSEFKEAYSFKSVPVYGEVERLIEKLQEERWLAFRDHLRIDWDAVALTMR